MASSHRDEISRLELLHAAHPDGLVFPHLADAYRRAGRYSQAEVVLTAGLRRHADYSSAHVVLGRLRLDQGKREQARASFERVLQLDPRNEVALEYLGELALEEGRWSDALARFRTLQRYKQDDALARRIEELAARVGEDEPPGDGAGRHGDRTGDGDPMSAREAPPAPETSGNARARSVARVAETEPGEVVTETIAELYERQGLHDRAAAVYRELLRRNPSDDRLRGKLQSLLEHRAERASSSSEAAGAAAPPGPARAGEQTANPALPAAGIRQELRRVLHWQGGAHGEQGRVPGPHGAPGRGSAASGTTVSPDRPAGAPDSPHAVPQSSPPPHAVAVADEIARPPRRPVVGAPSEPAEGTATRGAPTGAAAEGGTEPDTAMLIGIADLLVGLLEYRDPFFRGGSSLTRLLASSIAEDLGFTAEQKSHLALAAVLRDVGRLALGGRLVPLGRSTHTPDARRYIERHVDLALQLLEGVPLPTPVREAVRHHHERWDGAGYPDALAGENIPLLARVLAVADSYGAMVSPRTYRVPLKVPDAARELREEAGTRYDPEVVESLLRILEQRDQPHLGFVQRHHVLLVNPDQSDSVVTAAKLCSVGYLAEVAPQIPAARDRLRRAPVAALIVSAARPDDLTESFVRGVRADPSFSALPILAVNADGVAWRVRLLESGADVCFPPGVSHAELQGTLGALVRRTLRRTAVDAPSRADTPWLALQGDLQDFPMSWLLQVMKYDSRTAAIDVRTTKGEGAIYLRDGDAVHAHVRGGAVGEPALRKMLQWKAGRFTVQPGARPREETIRSSIMHLLLMQAVEEDHADAGIFGTVSPGD